MAADVEPGVPPDSGGQAPRAGWCRHSSIQRKSASSKAKWSSSERSSVNPFTRVTEMSTLGKTLEVAKQLVDVIVDLPVRVTVSMWTARKLSGFGVGR